MALQQELGVLAQRRLGLNRSSGVDTVAAR
jgi:hypothetical protein